MPRTVLPFENVGEMLEQLGGINPRRIRSWPPPGKATEKDVVAILDRENRLYELVDGVLVEKVMGFTESALADEAPAPLGDGAGVAVEFGSDVVVGGPVGCGAAEDEPRPEGEGLGGGVGVGQASEVNLVVGGEGNAWGLPGHEGRSWGGEATAEGDPARGRARGEGVQALSRTRVFMLTGPSCGTQA